MGKGVAQTLSKFQLLDFGAAANHRLPSGQCGAGARQHYPRRAGIRRSKIAARVRADQRPTQIETIVKAQVQAAINIEMHIQTLRVGIVNDQVDGRDFFRSPGQRRSRRRGDGYFGVRGREINFGHRADVCCNNSRREPGVGGDEVERDNRRRSRRVSGEAPGRTIQFDPTRKPARRPVQVIGRVTRRATTDARTRERRRNRRQRKAQSRRNHYFNILHNVSLLFGQ